jgi:hypothetical protein
MLAMERKQTHQNKDPAPPSIAAYVFHVRYTVCQDTTERSGEGSKAEEKRNSILPFIPFVPHGKIVNDTGKESRFGNT